MKKFPKKFNIMIWMPVLIIALGWLVFNIFAVNRASAGTVYSYGSCVPNETNCGEYFQAESPIVKDFRIDAPKTFNIPVSGPYGGSAPITVTPQTATLTATSGTGSCAMHVVGPYLIPNPNEGPNILGFILKYNDADLTLENFVVDAQGCQSQVTSTARTFNSTLKVDGTWKVCVSSCSTMSPVYEMRTGTLDVPIKVTLHPRAPLIGLIPPSFGFTITPFFPSTSATFTVKNVGDANTWLDSLAAKSSPLAPWLNFRSTNVGDGRGNPLGQNVSSVPLGFSIDGSFLTANGYIPGTYTSGITVSDDRGSKPIPAENSPQTLVISVTALRAGVSYLNKFTFEPPAISAATISGVAASTYFAVSAPIISSNFSTPYRHTITYDGACGLSGSTFYFDVYGGPFPVMFSVAGGLKINCPASEGTYSGTLTVSGQSDTARVPYTVTVTANPINVSTNAATNVTFDSAKLNGNVKASSPAWVGFQYSKQPLMASNLGTQTQLQYFANPGSGVDFFSNLSYVLDVNTYYYFRAVAYPNDLSQPFYGSTMFFKIPDPPPITITCQQDCNFTALAGGASASYNFLVNTPASFYLTSVGCFVPNFGPCVFSTTRFNISVSNSADSLNWLAIPPTLLTASTGNQGTFATSSFSMTINPSSLIAGSYQGRITVTVTRNYCEGSGCIPVPITSYSRSIPVNLSVAGPAGGGIVSSVWSIFKKSDLLNAIQNFPCATNCNYTATSLTANDYQTKLQITNLAGQTDSAVKDFRVNPALSVASVAVTEADYCVSGPAATFNWTLSGSGVQSAYQVQAGDTGGSDFTVLYADSGKVNSNGNSYSSTLTFPTNTDCSPKPDCTYDPNGPPAFNTTMKARVRVWGSTDTPSNWTYSGSWKTPKHAYPSVNFSWSPLSPSAEQQVQFSADLTQFFDAGGVGQRAWNWLFKAPSSSPSSTLQNPTYTYNSPSPYNVSLTVTDKDGYTCSRTKPISVDRPIPIWKEVGPK